jgi:transposase-like protein
MMQKRVLRIDGGGLSFGFFGLVQHDTRSVSPSPLLAVAAATTISLASAASITSTQPSKKVSGAPRPFWFAWCDDGGSSTTVPCRGQCTFLTTELTTQSRFHRGGWTLYTGSQERRRWPDDVKARIVMESLVPGTVVTQLAQRHGCRARQIHDWRRLARTGRLALPAPADGAALAAFVPLLPDHSAPAPAAPLPRRPPSRSRSQAQRCA